MKRKFLLPILSVCMVVALVSVGFAAWLITGNDTTNSEGNFVTYDVSNEFFNVSIAPTEEGAGEVVFGAPTETAADAWIKPGEGDKTEKLSATFNVTVTPADTNKTAAQVLTSNSVDKITVTLKSLNDIFDTLAADVTGGRKALVTYPTIAQGSTTATIKTSETLKTNGVVLEIPATAFASVSSVEITITFDWGAEFGGDNPYTYYSAQAVTAELAEEAGNNLKALNNETTGLNGQKYSLTLGIVKKPAPTPAA